MRDLWQLVKESVSKWGEDDALQFGAALAYYTVFSLAPVLVIVIAVAGAVFGRDAAQGEIVGEIREMVGEEGATAIQGLIESAGRPGASPVATAVGLVILLLGSTSVFAQLQSALNAIWNVPPREHFGLWDMIRHRFLSFAAVLGAGFLLSVSLVVSAAVAAFGKVWGAWLPWVSHALEIADLLGSVTVLTLLFAMIFKLLPDVEIRWHDVWVGAAVTAVLFVIGKFVIGFYLGRSDLGAAYGAASWLILVLAWVYYSSQIVLLGAEFTHVYAVRHGSGVNAGAGGVAAVITSPSTGQGKSTR